VKEDMVKTAIYKEMDSVRKSKGLTGLQDYANRLADDVSMFKKRSVEFSANEKVVLDYKA